MTRDEAIKRAAVWWASKLRGAEPDMSWIRDEGDAIASKVVGILTKGKTVPDEALFANALIGEIGKELSAKGYCDILMNYFPYPVLDAARKKAGISDLDLPFKTVCYIRPGREAGEYVVEAGVFGGELEELKPLVPQGWQLLF